MCAKKIWGKNKWLPVTSQRTASPTKSRIDKCRFKFLHSSKFAQLSLSLSSLSVCLSLSLSPTSSWSRGMAFSTANSAASGGRVLMCGASLEPVRSAGVSLQLLSVAAWTDYRLTVFGKARSHSASFPLATRCTTSSCAGSVSWGSTPTEWSPSSAR